MKIDLNVPVLDLKGVPMNENGTDVVTCGKILANLLIQGSKGDAIKYYDWAQALYKGSPIEVDNSDFKKIHEFTNANDTVAILAKAQILNALDACEKRSKEPVAVKPETISTPLPIVAEPTVAEMADKTESENKEE